MKALVSLLPQEVPHSDLINQADFSGDFAYNGKTIVARNSDLSATGNYFEAEVKGDATLNLAEDIPPVIAGRATADVTDVASLAKALEQKINGLDLVKTANVAVDLTAKDKGFLAQNIVARVAGDDLNATYEGQADIGDTITAQGAFTASAQDLPTIVRALKLELEQDVVVNTADVSGQINYSEDAINVTLDKADVQGENLTASYKGDVSVRDENISAKGDFTTNATAIPALVAALKIDAPQAAVLDKAKASGRVDYSKDAISVTLNEANLNLSLIHI